METSRAGSHYRRWRRREKKELCGLEVVMVSRVGAIVGTREKIWESREEGSPERDVSSWREGSKEVEM